MKFDTSIQYDIDNYLQDEVIYYPEPKKIIEISNDFSNIEKRRDDFQYDIDNYLQDEVIFDIELKNTFPLNEIEIDQKETK